MFSVGDVFFGLWVNVLFGQAKVDDVNSVLPFGARPAHQEVLWLDVSVDQAPGVDILHPGDLSVTPEDPSLASSADAPTKPFNSDARRIKVSAPKKFEMCKILQYDVNLGQLQIPNVLDPK